MQLRIAQLAPLWIEIPPKKFGGTERVINNLTKGFIGLGHQVKLFAVKGSKTKGELVEILDRPLLEILGEFNFKSIEAREFLSYSKLIDHIAELDIIHNHMGIHPLVLSKLIKVPFVTTYHSSIEPDFPYLAEEFKDCMYVSISNAQRKLAPYLNWIATIPNSVDTSLYSANLGKTENYLLFLGALNQNKGLDWAINVALETKEKLIIAGKFMNSKEEEWFDKEIKPKIDNFQIKFIGEVDDKQKQILFSNAGAFLFPSQWEEAFGLVALEAMACGTPVIGTNKGAIPEIIEHGRNGFIAEDYQTFINLIGQIKEISREECRKSVEENYSIDKVASMYSDLFINILNKNV
jgi:glycosyltransferase involved in cell wall biosynthesis